MRITNNNAAYNVWSNQKKTVAKLKKSIQKLSAGVMMAIDDPAGIGISERARSQVGGISMSINNVDNSISMLNTTDSYLQNVGVQLGRMKELSIQANGIMSPADMKNIETEFKSLQDEITRVTSKDTAAATFNGLYLTRGGTGVDDGSGGIVPGNMSVQVGPDTNQEQEIDLPNLDVSNTADIGTVVTHTYDSNNQLQSTTQTSVQWGDVINSVSGISVNSNMAIGKIDQAISFVANSRASIGAQQSRMENTKSALLSYEANLREAESKIRDVDMARESTRFTSTMIQQKAGYAMLAQTSNMAAMPLSLI